MKIPQLFYVICLLSLKTIFCFDCKTPETKLSQVPTAQKIIPFPKVIHFLRPRFKTEWLYDAIANTGGSLAMHLNFPNSTKFGWTQWNKIWGEGILEKKNRDILKKNFPE